MIAINADRVALGAGAINTRARIAVIATHAAADRSLRNTMRATKATIQPRTARLKPEMARMCASPTARKPFSIGAYPASESPSTSATSIAPTPSSGWLPCAGSLGSMPASSPVRNALRIRSRSRSMKSETGVRGIEPSTNRQSSADSTDRNPMTPLRAASDRGSRSPGLPISRDVERTPSARTRSVTFHGGGAPATKTAIRDETREPSSSAPSTDVRTPSPPTNTTSRSTARQRISLSKCLARMSVANPCGAKPSSTVPSSAVIAGADAAWSPNLIDGGTSSTRSRSLAACCSLIATPSPPDASRMSATTIDSRALIILDALLVA